MITAALKRAQQLIRPRSSTPDDAGRQDLTSEGTRVGAVRAVTAIEPELFATGGTSDGRFITDICPQVPESGPVNACIRMRNGHVEVEALDTLKSIYRQVLERLLLRT